VSKGKTIAPSHVEGRASRQAHADLPAGTYERELGREGFYGPASHMYHAHPPTAWSAIDGPLRPRAFDANKIAEPSASPWAAQRIFGNAHVNFSLWHLDGAMPDLARSGDGDVLLFVHQGAGELFCDYGHLSIRDGDYVVLPRGTMWRIEAEGRLSALIIEALGSAYELPERGLVGAHAQFDPAVLDIPAIDDAFHAQQGDGEWRVEVKRHGEISRVRYGFNPLDAVGWHGDLMPVRLNWSDIRPLMSPRYHLPPSAHTTFIAGRFVICTFVPKPM
jgi:homogentisate 1,2-dioxygenase